MKTSNSASLTLLMASCVKQELEVKFTLDCWCFGWEGAWLSWIWRPTL